jgi:hypothetical protein
MALHGQPFVGSMLPFYSGSLFPLCSVHVFELAGSHDVIKGG